MDVFVSYYGSVLLDPSKAAEIQRFVDLLREEAKALADEDAHQTVAYDASSGKLHIDLEGITVAKTHNRIVKILRGLGRYAQGVGSFTIEYDEESYTIWIGAENEVRRTKVGIYLQATVQLLKKAAAMADNPEPVHRLIEAIESLEEMSFARDLNLLPPL